MKERAYYNEIDPFAAEWLRNLIKQGTITDGVVDARSIHDVRPEDLEGFTRVHFFAGIGGWDAALNLAGWSYERNGIVWTGSCPCQPFSSAGHQKGKADERHLFPTWLDLIRKCRPATIYGEQVSSAISLGWLDDVYTGLETENYALGSAVLPACGGGAPHRRDRLWFIAKHNGVGHTDTVGERFENERCTESARRSEFIGDAQYVGMADTCNGQFPISLRRSEKRNGARPVGTEYAGHLGNAKHNGLHAATFAGSNGQNDAHGAERSFRAVEPARASHTGIIPAGLVHKPCGERLQGFCGDGDNRSESGRLGPRQDRSITTAGFWGNAIWIECADGKARPVEPSIPLLAHGVSGRMAVCLPAEQALAQNREIIHWYNRTGALKGFGNAIVHQVGADFIMASM